MLSRLASGRLCQVLYCILSSQTADCLLIQQDFPEHLLCAKSQYHQGVKVDGGRQCPHSSCGIQDGGEGERGAATLPKTRQGQPLRKDVTGGRNNTGRQVEVGQ